MNIQSLTLSIIFIMSVFISCSESVPRNRPDLRTQPGELVTPPETEEEVEEFTRPSDAITITSACVCEDGKNIGIAVCDAICDQRSKTPERRLFLDIRTNFAAKNSALEDLSQFCSTGEGETEIAQCQVEVKDPNGNLLTPLQFENGIASGQESFSLNAQDLPTSLGLRLTIVETTSQARSKAYQIMIEDPTDEGQRKGALATMSVSQYTCFSRVFETDTNTGEIFIEDANRFHFYFTQESRPEPLRPSTTSSFYCHDIEQSPLVPVNDPLLEETPGFFSLWDKNDSRFFDIRPKNQVKDIADLFLEAVEAQGASANGSNLDFFVPLKFPSGIDDGDSNIGDNESDETTGESIETTLGFMMTPFLDPDTLKAFCPNKLRYKSDNPIFKAMEDFLGDTEALYLAKQDNVCDNILVRESIVSKIWFFKDGGLHIRPTTDTIRGKKVQFYWPPDYSSPFIKKPDQRVYSILSTDEFNQSACGTQDGIDGSSQDSDGVSSNFPPHDKRIGCIPALSN